jgi:hypothetical protein
MIYQNDASARQRQANDPEWKKVGRDVVDVAANVPKGLLGIDPAQDESSSGYVANAMTQIGQAVDPIVKGLGGTSLAVNPYWNDIPGRKSATKLYQALSQRLRGEMGPAFEAAGKGYPRVAANIFPQMGEIDRPVPGRIGTSMAGIVLPEHGPIKPREPMPLKVTNYGVQRTMNNPGEARNTAYHEFTHGAAGLGNKNADELYQLSQDLEGYARVPFETNARVAGEAAEGSTNLERRQNINQAMTNIADRNYVARPSLQQMPRNIKAKKIKDLLSNSGVNLTPGVSSDITPRRTPKRLSPKEYMEWKFGTRDKKSLTAEQIEDLEGFKERYNRRAR